MYLISLTREFEHSEIIVSKQLRKPGLTIMLGKLLYLLQIRMATWCKTVVSVWLMLVSQASYIKSKQLFVQYLNYYIFLQTFIAYNRLQLKLTWSASLFCSYIVYSSKMFLDFYTLYIWRWLHIKPRNISHRFL